MAVDAIKVNPYASTVVLVSDGIKTCGKDPCDVRYFSTANTTDLLSALNEIKERVVEKKEITAPKVTDSPHPSPSRFPRRPHPSVSRQRGLGPYL